ncbi:selenocysteine-specific elongation factor [bacterium BMS3Abin14]|nr:selenocysteine-specific elongation factor [bacterium BMS3Abin14]
MTDTRAHIIIGTAGHIDHGKTALVRSLTGINTDRLKEEKERGITIELGFAPLTLPSGLRVGLVDVPGHERFVRNMVAGATGIDLVLLVVAADEGVMPQTREHLDICQLLGTRGGIVVLSKIDMVEADWLEMVTEDVREYLAETFLCDAPIIPFSAVDGTGKDELLKAMEQAAMRVPGKSLEGVFRLPVDRVFSMKGFGTVVTGTLISGRIAVGEEVNFFPEGRRAKLRGIQVHGNQVRESSAGTRTAMNLQGIEKGQIRRGETAAHAGSLIPTYLLDVHIRLLSSAPRPLKNRTRVRLHLYTSEIMARVVLLEDESLDPGHEAVAQIRLEASAVAQPGDRFVLRSYSPITTIGGGVVLDPVPAKHRRMRKTVIAHLARLHTDNPGNRMEALLDEAGDYGGTAGVIGTRAGVSVPEAIGLLRDLEADGKAVLIGDGPGALAYSSVSFDGLKDRLVKVLHVFHRAHPLKKGIGKEELRMKSAGMLPDRPYRNLLSALAEKNVIGVDGNTVFLMGHSAAFTPEQQKLAKRVGAILEAAGLSAPFVLDLASDLGVDAPHLKAVLGLMCERGEAVRVKDDFYVHPDANSTLMARVDSYFGSNAELSMKGFREIAGTSRKWMIPLLEYLDRMQVTMRRGDVRIRRGGTQKGGTAS